MGVKVGEMEETIKNLKLRKGKRKRIISGQIVRMTRIVKLR